MGSRTFPHARDCAADRLIGHPHRLSGQRYRIVPRDSLSGPVFLYDRPPNRVRHISAPIDPFQVRGEVVGRVALGDVVRLVPGSWRRAVERGGDELVDPEVARGRVASVINDLQVGL